MMQRFNINTRTIRGRLGAAAWALCLCLTGLLGSPPGRAQAATNPAYMDLQVTFSGSLAISVDGTIYSTRTINAGANALVVSSSATVTNTGGLTEMWQLNVSTVSGGGDWAVVGTTSTPPDVDQYAFQALFISSATTGANQPASYLNGCPISTANVWGVNASTVTGSPSIYQSSMYADNTVVGGASGLPDLTSGIQDGDMLSASGSPNGSGTRGLCTRIYMPVGTETTTAQVIRLTITAVLGN